MDHAMQTADALEPGMPEAAYVLASIMIGYLLVGAGRTLATLLDETDEATWELLEAARDLEIALLNLGPEVGK